MDAAAALIAPPVKDLGISSLSVFLGVTGLRVVQAHDDGRPFGLLLKGLLHGTLGPSLRCGRLDLRTLDERCPATSAALQPWIDLAGVRGVFPPPAGLYLFRGPELVGFHPPLEPDAMEPRVLARTVVRGLRVLIARHELAAAGREALEGRPEGGVCRFFKRAAVGRTPARAPAAGDRRAYRRRRSESRNGRPRRESERLQADLASAFQFLGLSTDAPLRAVRKVRNRWMRANHPDLLGEHPERVAEATRLTVRMNEAYGVIRRAREAEAQAQAQAQA